MKTREQKNINKLFKMALAKAIEELNDGEQLRTLDIVEWSFDSASFKLTYVDSNGDYHDRLLDVVYPR